MTNRELKAPTSFAVVLLVTAVFSLVYGVLNWDRTNIAPPLALSGAFFALVSVYWFFLKYRR